MDSKGDASTGSEGLYDWTAPRFGGLSVASEPKPELTLADGARFPEFRPDDGSLFACGFNSSGQLGLGHRRHQKRLPHHRPTYWEVFKTQSKRRRGVQPLKPGSLERLNFPGF